MNKETKILVAVAYVIGVYLIFRNKKSAENKVVTSNPSTTTPNIVPAPITTNVKTPSNSLKEVLIENMPIVKRDSGGMPEPPLKRYSQVIRENYSLVPPQNDRQTNINNMFSTTDNNGIIRNPNSSYNESKFDDYVRRFKITQSEIDVAKSYYPNAALTKSNYMV